MQRFYLLELGHLSYVQMEILSEVIAVINSGFFAGAALAISLSEHLARQNMDPQQGLIHFQQSHKRIAPVLVHPPLTTPDLSSGIC